MTANTLRYNITTSTTQRDNEMSTLTSLAKKYESISNSIVKFESKGNEDKVEMWACRLVDVAFDLEEFSKEELSEVAKTYRTVLELV